LQSLEGLSAAAAAIAPTYRAEDSCERVIDLMFALAETTPDMEPRYALGDEIYFPDALDSRAFMHGEWGRTEESGVWMVGKNAGLSLRFEPESQRALVLRALVFPFVAESHPVMTVGVYVSHDRIAEWKFDVADPEGTDARWCEAAIPAAGGSPSAELEIGFVVDNPASPAQLGISGDLRTLGLGFRKLLVSEVE
jgi:hypothetical protein